MATVDPVTGQTVATAHAVHDLETNEVTLYIDDGSGMDPDVVQIPSSVLAANIAPGVATLPIADASDWPRRGSLLIETEVREYTDVDESVVPHQVALAAVTGLPHLAGVEVTVVEVVTASAPDGRQQFTLRQPPLVQDSLRLWTATSAGATATLLTASDFFIHRGTGDIQLATGMVATLMLLAHYSYHSGLVRTVQRKIGGDTNDFTNYPGVSAYGLVTIIDLPTIRRVRIVLGISAKTGYTEADLIAPVRQAVEAVVNSLRIGQEVVLEAVRSAAMGVPGVYDVVQIVPDPTVTTIPVLEHELARSVSASGTSLVEIR
jgi:hypothetical protein